MARAPKSEGTRRPKPGKPPTTKKEGSGPWNGTSKPKGKPGS